MGTNSPRIRRQASVRGRSSVQSQPLILPLRKAVLVGLADGVNCNMSEKHTAQSGPAKPERKEFGIPDLGNKKSFRKAERAAREILREKGFTEEQIERELQRVKRQSLD